MTAFFYYLFLKPLSLLPMSVLHVISDGLYLIVYSLVGYRKKVVRMNIENAFPDKSKEEIDQMIRGFYGHFCDLIMESVKNFSISAEEAVKRCPTPDLAVFEKLYKEGKSFIFVGGHYANWELFAVSTAAIIPHTMAALYAPLTNKFFDELIQETRGKTGLRLFPKNKPDEMFEMMKKGPTAFIFGADQSPSSLKKKVYWTNFLNQDTPVMLGTEKFAKKYNIPVVFGGIYRIKRGFYEFRATVLTDNPKETAEFEITELHTRILEEQILTDPQYYLWTHKRWKHKRESVNAV